MRTKKEIIEGSKAFVAKITGLGTTLVTGHKASYWEQAMQLAMEEWEIEVKKFNQPAELKQAHVSGMLPTTEQWAKIEQDFYDWKNECENRDNSESWTPSNYELFNFIKNKIVGGNFR